MKQQRTLIVLAVALVTAVGATYFVYQAVSGRPPVQVEVGGVDVVQASRNIPAGTRLTASDLRVSKFPRDAFPPGAILDPKLAVERSTLENLLENDVVTDRKLAAKDAGDGAEALITPGMRMVSVRVNDVVGVAGFAGPGSHVDVIATVSNGGAGRGPIAKTVVSNVLVLKTGTRADQSNEGRGTQAPQPVVSLLVTPEDGERIALAQSEGRISLSLRSPRDLDSAPTNGVGVPGMLGRPAPESATPVDAPKPQRRPRVEPITEAAPPPPPPPPPPPAVIKIETIRGGKRTDEVID